MGSWCDRWRFHLPSSESFRGKALAGLCFEHGLNLERERALLELSELDGTTEFSLQDVLTQEGLQLNPSFPELDPRVIHEVDWKLVQTRPYFQKEAIHLKELRAVLFALRRRVRQSRFDGMRHLFLCDNLG
eukprot:6488065-Amphidinium_carterae.1